MGTTLKPGNMGDGFDDTDNSIAETMDLELDRMLREEGHVGLSFDMNDHDVRSRRRLVVAIARGMVKHLKDNPDAFNFQTTNVDPVVPRTITGTDI